MFFSDAGLANETRCFIATQVVSFLRVVDGLLVQTTLEIPTHLTYFFFFFF